MTDRRLPVHGFVLAGGKSARMGQDKALLEFRGQPMVEIAVEKLRSFCAEVSIAGNREDLSRFAHVIEETRMDVGPAAGIEAGLKACGQAWALFVPVDVPVVPAGLLRVWAEDAIEADAKGPSGSYLLAEGRPQPAFCVLSKGTLPAWRDGLDQGERRLEMLLGRARAPGRYAAGAVEAGSYAPRATSLQMKYWFSNVNTPQELAEAEVWAEVES